MRIVLLGSGLTFLAACLAAAGCHSEKEPGPAGPNPASGGPSSAKGGTTTSTTGAAASTGASTSGDKGDSKNASGESEKPPTPGAPLSAIPADLKTDVYDYYSLSNTKPLNLSMTISNQPGEHMSGTQTITLEKVDKGVPYFKITRTGEFAKFGEQELRLEKDALYNVSSSIAKIGKHDIEMPAVLKPGVTWKTHTEIEQGTSPLTDDSVWKVVGFRTVQTPRGEQQALYVTSTGKGSVGGKTVKTESQNWFVKDVGPVKEVLTTIDDKGTKQEITIQETK
jgi:hypothetical protein